MIHAPSATNLVTGLGIAALINPFSVLQINKQAIEDLTPANYR